MYGIGNSSENLKNIKIDEPKFSKGKILQSYDNPNFQ